MRLKLDKIRSRDSYVKLTVIEADEVVKVMESRKAIGSLNPQWRSVDVKSCLARVCVPPLMCSWWPGNAECLFVLLFVGGNGLQS